MPFAEATEVCTCGHTEEWEKTALPKDHLAWCPLRAAPADAKEPVPGQMDLLARAVSL
jgi:hypothetical protein